jgi:gliding motility-associated-like protein
LRAQAFFTVPDRMMRLFITKLFALAIILIFALKAKAQTCTGSLGDPVINQNFGAGANLGPALGGNFTNYNFVRAQCPNDGMYTITHSTDTCFGSTWYNLTQDHTGDPNGYMMLVNASFAPGIFYVQNAYAGQLCPNTTYEFAAWILNIIRPSACGGVSIQPNITFSIETTTGVILKTYNTGNIPPTDAPIWKQYGTFFTTPANPIDVVVKMVNNAPGGCGNDLALDDITFRACGPIIQAGFGSIAGADRQDLCQGGNADYTLQANVVGGNNSAYQWQINNNGAGWVDIAGETTQTLNLSFKNAIPAVHQYRLGVSNGSNISSINCRVYSSPLTLNVNPLPVVPTFPVQTFCAGNTMQLIASGGATYIWSGPNLLPTTQNPLIINNVSLANAGTYTVQVISNKGCPAAPVQAVVKIVPKVVPAISADPAPVCAGVSVPLTASGGLYYKWIPSTGLDHDDIPNPVATPLQTTTYSVRISNDGCTDSTKSVTVAVYQNPVANAGSAKKIFEGQSVTLNGTIQGDEIISAYWTPSTGLDNPMSPTPVATPVQNTTYTLNVISMHCGISTSSVFVRVLEKITIPNTFTPNGDGINDYWNIKKLITYPECSLMIYSRDGQQVYKSAGYAKPWDGSNNGSNLPAGTYYYILDLKNDIPKIAGWVLIVR